jgi:hypothetical protein
MAELDDGYDDGDDGSEDDEGGIFANPDADIFDESSSGDPEDVLEDEAEEQEEVAPSVRQLEARGRNADPPRYFDTPLPQGTQRAGKLRLVGRFDDQGQAVVARFEGRKQLEHWRRPTEAEARLLLKNKQFMRGGPLAAQRGGMGDFDEDGNEKRGSKLKWGIGFALVAALVGGGYYLYKTQKDEDEEIDDNTEDL